MPSVASSSSLRPRARVSRKRISSSFKVSAIRRFGALQFGIGRAHFRHQGRHQPVHQGILGAQQMRMAHAAAHDAAQHIAAAFIGGQHAVGDQERSRAQMVGDDAMAEHRIASGLHAGSIDRGRDQMAEQIDVVIAGDALQDGGDALQPHAGVDGGLGQIEAGLLVHLLELHEDQIPEFDETVAIFVGRAGRAARTRFRPGRRRFPSRGRRDRYRPSTRNWRWCRCG